MLTVAAASKLTDAIDAAFAAIGVESDTKMPRAKGNLEPVAWELFIAQRLDSSATRRKAKATKEAIRLGIMFDHEKQPLASGYDAPTYEGDVVKVSVAVGNPGTRVDVAALGVALVRSGVKLATFERLLKESMVENRPPHKFTSALVVARG